MSVLVLNLMLTFQYLPPRGFLFEHTTAFVDICRDFFNVTNNVILVDLFHFKIAYNASEV